MKNRDDKFEDGSDHERKLHFFPRFLKSCLIIACYLFCSICLTFYWFYFVGTAHIANHCNTVNSNNNHAAKNNISSNNNRKFHTLPS